MNPGFLKELYHGYVATRIHLPLSGAARQLRRFGCRIRGKSHRFLQNTQLPEISWRDCTQVRSIRVWEHQKRNGDVRTSELGVLCALAAESSDETNLFEIGTFDGRSTLNLAMNSPARCKIYTLDLPPSLTPLFSLAYGERHMVDKPEPGSRYEKYQDTFPAAIGKIHQLLGDSAAFDYSPYKDSCSLVFVDGSHTYDYVLSDTRAAMDMAKKGGVIVWHDYGIWEGVTKALDQLEQLEGYGLRNIRGTSLVYWRNT